MSAELVRNTPEALGIPSAAVSAFLDAVEASVGGLHGLMLLRHGQVAAEGWWSPYRPEYPHALYSLSKAFTSIAVGLAINEGHLCLDDPVVWFFPEAAPAHIAPHLDALKVRHLLSMNTGHHRDASGAAFRRVDRNIAKRFLRLPIRHEPGTWFVYNTAATYMLSAIVHRRTGMPLAEYLQPRLFDPLGIAPPRWESDPDGVNMGGFGLNLKTEDIARFGQMLLQKGSWNGREVVPAEWIERATSLQSDNANQPGSPDWTQGYGYQFWLCRHGAYRGDGAFGQYCLVMPEADAVLAITSGVSNMQAVLDAVWEHLLPAMGAPLPPDPAATALVERLAGLEIPIITGKRESPTGREIAGLRYKLDENPAGFKTVTFRSRRPQATLRISDRAGAHRILIGHGQMLADWTTLEITLGRVRRQKREQNIAASGAWTAPDTYTARLVFTETPFIRTVTLRFVENELDMTIASNVGFEEGATLHFHGVVVDPWEYPVS